MKHFLSILREANIARQKLWVDGDEVPNVFRALETCGETGELLNVVKKIERESRGWRGSRATRDDLADELADVVICLDLLSNGLGYKLADLYSGPQTAQYGAPILQIAIGLNSTVGRIASNVAFGIASNVAFDGPLARDYYPELFTEALAGVEAMSREFLFSLESAIKYKFNKTSLKVGLPIEIARDYNTIVAGSSGPETGFRVVRADVF